MRALYISLLLFFTFAPADEFSDGPYGIEYFDTAGPFVVQDLNTDVSGDINFDDILNIQVFYHVFFRIMVRDIQIHTLKQ